MIHWRPSISELTLPFKFPRPWDLSLERFGKGIDNAHVDVFLSQRLTGPLRESVRELIEEEFRTLRRREPMRSSAAADLDAFSRSYVDLFEATLQRAQQPGGVELLALLQLSLLKFLLEIVAGEMHRQRNELKFALHAEDARASVRNIELHDSLVALNREEHGINRRVLHLLFERVRELEDEHLQTLRASVAGDAWPLPEEALFNPVLAISALDAGRGLVQDYPIACLAEDREAEWLRETNQCICKVFQHYLPSWTREPTSGSGLAGKPGAQPERRDQGLLRGFLDTEILLSRFMSPDEYRTGRLSWLDEPQNLRLFLEAETQMAPPTAHKNAVAGYWDDPRWTTFRRAVTAELFHCLDVYGLSSRIALVYMLPVLRGQLGRPVPLSLAWDYIEGRLSRRRLSQQIENARLGLDAGALSFVLDRAATELKRLSPTRMNACLARYLVEFLGLRRDLKLAYRTYEAMDGIRLIEDPEEVKLSRSNATLQEFPCPDELGPLLRRIRAHAVIKADLRGSTRITDRLRAKGLNPASHFSLNFFDPVNKLLGEFGAEKLFVEGDAVILAIFEHDDEGPGLTVARACGLARRILQVVTLQNVVNRKHDLPELELGLGIAFSRREPNFLFDEGRRIMISGAINRADRLSSCSSVLRRQGFAPRLDGFRVEVVRDKVAETSPGRDEDLLSFNVNGVRLEEAAFLQLQREIHFRQMRLQDVGLGDELFFGGSFPDLTGREHWLVVRYAPVRDWDGKIRGGIEMGRRHFFEIIVDESLSTQFRKQAQRHVP